MTDQSEKIKEFLREIFIFYSWCLWSNFSKRKLISPSNHSTQSILDSHCDVWNLNMPDLWWPQLPPPKLWSIKEDCLIWWSVNSTTLWTLPVCTFLGFSDSILQSPHSGPNPLERGNKPLPFRKHSLCLFHWKLQYSTVHCAQVNSTME